MIKVGDQIPEVTLYMMNNDNVEPVHTHSFFAGKKSVLFAVPAAFSPTCSAKHVPGFLQHHDQIKSKGVDNISCLSVNDAYVMNAWAESQKTDHKISMLADGSADFTKAVDLVLDATNRGMGLRSKRYAMIIEDKIVKSLFIEVPGAFEVSCAESVLKYL
ncbi:MAG: peroxiredoxin [Alphaproteobacteria bacterium]|nr:peroxiredoxin [Alphaproteobacteria bacterium]